MPKSDRLQVSIVAYDDDGPTEVFWARSHDIITTSHEGSFTLYDDGSATMRFRDDEDDSYVLYIIGNRVVVSASEDCDVDAIKRDDKNYLATIVFDSIHVKLDQGKTN